MKTMMLAAAAVLSLGVGSAFANEGDGGQVANTFFTELPGVIAQAPSQQVPSAVARNQTGGAPTAAFVTRTTAPGPGCSLPTRATADQTVATHAEGAGSKPAPFRCGQHAATPLVLAGIAVGSTGNVGRPVQLVLDRHQGCN